MPGILDASLPTFVFVLLLDSRPVVLANDIDSNDQFLRFLAGISPAGDLHCIPTGLVEVFGFHLFHPVLGRGYRNLVEATFEP